MPELSKSVDKLLEDIKHLEWKNRIEKDVTITNDGIFSIGEIITVYKYLNYRYVRAVITEIVRPGEYRLNIDFEESIWKRDEIKKYDISEDREQDYSLFKPGDKVVLNYKSIIESKNIFEKDLIKFVENPENRERIYTIKFCFKNNTRDYWFYTFLECDISISPKHYYLEKYKENRFLFKKGDIVIIDPYYYENENKHTIKYIQKLTGYNNFEEKLFRIIESERTVDGILYTVEGSDKKIPQKFLSLDPYQDILRTFCREKCIMCCSVLYENCPLKMYKK